MQTLIQALPKVELHLHIEGSLEPELMFQLAKRNQVDLPYPSIEALKAAYQFDSLQSFLDLYYQGMQVLLHTQDFYDLTMAYLKRVAQDNVRHVELFFDPQAHTERGVDFETVINGIDQALKDGSERYGISSKIIMCFLRHLSQEDAFATLKMAKPYRDKIIAVGLDSSEKGNPPEKFTDVFKKAEEHGYLRVAHLGEECPAQTIIDGIECLNIQRVDHGVQAIHDPQVIDILAKSQIPLTVCPLSNIKLRVFDSMKAHPIKKLLDQGICVTINSDDPAYFGGYMNDNFQAVQAALDLDSQSICKMAENAIQASFLSMIEKADLLNELKQVQHCY